MDGDDNTSDDAGEPESASSDVAIVYGVTPDERGLEVIRRREQAIELGTMRPLREGSPIHGEVVKLAPRADCPIAFDVHVEVPAPKRAQAARADTAGTARGRPAQVASDRYREGWDAIWSRPRKNVVN